VRLLSLSPRRAIAATFGGYGLVAGLWAGANGATVARLGVGPAAFGMALTAMIVVYLLAMASAGAVAARIGARRTLVLCLVLLGPSLALMLYAPSGAFLSGALALYGAVAGLMDSAMNAEGARIEHRAAKPVFVQFHAMASAAAAATAVLGSYLAARGLVGLGALAVGLALAGVALAVQRTIAARIEEPALGGLGAPSRVVDRPLAVLGLAVGVSIASEASALFWSSLMLRRAAPDYVALAGLGVTFFSGFQAAARFGLDRIRRGVDDRTLMLVSFAVAALGYLIVAADLGFAASAAGFAVVGAGTAAIVPCGFSLAARRPGLSAGLSISAVSFFGLFPRAPAPLLTGAVAQAFSLSAAFVGLAALLGLAGLGVAAFVAPALSRNLASEGLAE
jgi:hypothetical protein